MISDIAQVSAVIVNCHAFWCNLWISEDRCHLNSLVILVSLLDCWLFFEAKTLRIILYTSHYVTRSRKYVLSQCNFYEGTSIK